MLENEVSIEEQLRSWTSQTPPWEVEGVIEFFHDMKLLNKDGEKLCEKFYERYCKNRSYEPRPVLSKSDLVMRIENSIEQEMGVEPEYINIDSGKTTSGFPVFYDVTLRLKIPVAQDKDSPNPYKEKRKE